MIELRDGLILYHGSYTQVRNPDLSKCARFKDFGKGFYLSSSLRQATSFARLSLRKARENGLVSSSHSKGFVSAFRVALANDEAIKVRTFPTADVDWLKCISAHRRRGAFESVLAEMSNYDVIIGKVANDQTNNTLVTYLSGGYGPFQSEDAMRICIGLLLPDRLEDQLCFRTRKAISLLRYEEGRLV